MTESTPNLLHLWYPLCIIRVEIYTKLWNRHYLIDRFRFCYKCVLIFQTFFFWTRLWFYFATCAKHLILERIHYSYSLSVLSTWRDRHVKQHIICNSQSLEPIKLNIHLLSSVILIESFLIYCNNSISGIDNLETAPYNVESHRS